MTFSVFSTVSTSRAEDRRALPRGIHLRRAGDEDETATFDVMRKSMGYEMSWEHHAPTRRHLRMAPHSSFWVAEETFRFGKPRIVGYAHGSLRERVWSLTEFFVLPSHVRQGIGRALLERFLADGAHAGADTRLVLASQHPSADSLYIRLAGCFPRLPMFLLSGPAANLRVRPGAAAITDEVIPDGVQTIDWYHAGHSSEAPPLIASPIVLTAEVQARFDEIDRVIVGYARTLEHSLWATEMGGLRGASRLFRDAVTQRIVGYVYFGPHSSGPALALEPGLLPAMIAHVTHISRHYTQHHGLGALSAPAEPYWAVAGVNEVLLRWLLECGWQIVFQYLFMSSRPLGQMDRYACHNPLYML